MTSRDDSRLWELAGPLNRELGRSLGACQLGCWWLRGESLPPSEFQPVAVIIKHTGQQSCKDSGAPQKYGTLTTRRAELRGAHAKAETGEEVGITQPNRSIGVLAEVGGTYTNRDRLE